MASDKAKVNGRRREQAEATRIGEDNRDDDEEEKYKTIGDEGITVDFRFIKVHTSK